MTLPLHTFESSVSRTALFALSQLYHLPTSKTLCESKAEYYQLPFTSRQAGKKSESVMAFVVYNFLEGTHERPGERDRAEY